MISRRVLRWRHLARSAMSGAMLKPDPRAGGCFLSLLILTGFAIGLSIGDPVAGALIGTAAGILVALAVWISDRWRRRRGDSG